MNPLHPSPCSPRVAICICTYHRAELLGPLLKHLADTDFGGYDRAAIHILVVDNAPANGATKARCEALEAYLPMQLHYVSEPRAGITHARNRAVATALEQGVDFIAFIDDDDLPRPDWLRQLLDCQRATDADVVAGTWVVREDEAAWLRKSSQPATPPASGRRLDKRRAMGLPSHASTCNLLAGRDILQQLAQLGPVFCHDFLYTGGEDKDFVLRAIKQGARVEVCRASVIQRRHEADRYTTRGLVRRGFKNGCSRVNLLRHHGSLEQLLSCGFSSFMKLLYSIVLLPLAAFSRARFAKALYRLSKSSGALYAIFTGRSINYYAK